MADNYVQFSFAIPLDTPEKEAWAREAVAFLDDANELPTLERLAALHAGEPADTHVFDELLPDEFLDSESLGFNVAVDDDGIWMYSEDSGTPDNTIPLIQAYLLKFDPTGAVAFEWADTCSRPRLDEFGGGAAFVTATSVEYMNTGTWVSRKLNEHKENAA